jgi:hypothetical protein
MPPDHRLNDVPSFPEASERMSAFLRDQGVPDEIVWVAREELTSYRRQIWFRSTAAGRRTLAAEALFEAGRQRGLGVELRAVCQIEDATACCVWVPKNAAEAEQAMLPPTLKLWVPTPLIGARVVRSRLRWGILRWLNASPPVGDALVSSVPPLPETPARQTARTSEG